MKSMSGTGIVSILSMAACVGSVRPPTEESAPAVARTEPPLPLTPHAPEAVNPFDGARLYVSPDQARTATALASKFPAQALALTKLASVPTAVWLDSIAKVGSVPRHLDAALRQEAAEGKPVVPVFVVYDLPGRDCSAQASNGEFRLGDEGRYRDEYIDALAAAFTAHPSQRIVAILEPDSLANLATNLAVAKCAAAAPAYRRGVSYAIARLSLPNVFLYLDAAHSGWLGWQRNLTKIAHIFAEVLATAGGPDRIRGFAVNVANYNPVRIENARRGAPGDPAPDELTYIDDLSQALSEVGIANKGYLIDTSRNGRLGIRSSGASWCNVLGAGLGERPHIAPAPSVDAYLWIKVPGESDGTSNPSAARFDPSCASADATPGAPEAGELFPRYLVELVKNARPPL